MKNEQGDWKQRLDDLNQLPAEAAFDKYTAWDKLDHRLQAKQKQKRPGWFWSAACAVVLLIGFLGIGELFFTAKSRILPTAPGSIKKDFSPARAFSAASTKQPIIVHPQLKTTALPAQTRRKLQSMSLRTHYPSRFVIARAVRSDSVIPSRLPSIIEVHTVVSAPLVKKPLPVVHANELNEHDHEATRYATLPRPSSLGKIFYTQPFSNQATTSSTTDLKPVITLKN